MKVTFTIENHYDIIMTYFNKLKRYGIWLNVVFLGDSSGWTRGLMMASVMGVLMGQIIE